MKLILSICTLFFILPLAQSQSTGKISYEDILDMHHSLPPEKEELKHMIPQYSTSKWELTFTDNESIYHPFKETELTGANANQSGYYMRFGRENRSVYKNLSKDKLTDSRDFMQKQFLIKGFVTTRQWKIGKKQKQILGYNCMEASCKIDSATMVTAWFSPQLPISNGPVDFQGLPGMILQISINDGERTITATEVKLKDVDTSVIIEPTKGKEVTSDEFEKIREEKMKEMNLQQRGSGPVMMTRRH